MSCEFCGKEIMKDEEFILVGKYPGLGKVWLRSSVVRWVPPDTYGKLYHKSCFLESLKKQTVEEKE